MAPPFDRPMLAVFCGARAGVSTAYADEAAAVGREIARAGAGLVFGGGRVGLMGVLADAVLEEGGIAFGVIPAGLFAKEVAHGGLTRLEVVNTMHERKALMADMADGFLALPGGYGTLDEFFEIVTWRQLGHHARPIVLYNRSGFFDPLLAATRRIADEGFAREGADFFAVETDPAAAVRRALSGASRPALPAHGGEDRR
ncbi:MAG TPA: TIGR00730 family Rossman fold protein [Thermoanaerobaculia bacterium]